MRRLFPCFFLCLSIGCAGAAEQPDHAKTPVEHHADELFQRGQTYAERGDSIRAEQYLSLALETGYDEHDVVPLLMQACVASGRLRTALNYAEPYLRTYPDEQALRFLVANLYVALDEPTKAYRELERVLSAVPDHAPSHYLMAVVSWESFDDAGAARQHFQHYLKLEARGPHAAEAALWLREHPDPAVAREFGVLTPATSAPSAGAKVATADPEAASAVPVVPTQAASASAVTSDEEAP